MGVGFLLVLMGAGGAGMSLLVSGLSPLTAATAAKVGGTGVVLIYTPDTFPYQIRIFFFSVFSCINSLLLQIYQTSCLELVRYSTLHNVKFHPLSHLKPPE